jgi:hypothetical protein
MNKFKLLKKNITASLVCTALLMFASVSGAQTITVLGANAPAPGPNDQYQTNFQLMASSPPPGGGAFNYYVNADPAPGQTFTTGSNPAGYTLASLALFDADNTGGGFGNETFTLNIYTVSGSTATVLASYVSQSITIPDFQWFQWTSLGAILQPNTQYAYAMYANGAGWMNLGNVSGNLYSGGQVAIVPRSGGTMTFSSASGWNASFDVGLAPITAVTATQPTFSPSANVFPGTTVTASAQVAGPTPYRYQWQTDGGSGGTLTNIPGANAATLSINTTGFVPGNYNYDLIVSNNNSSATSSVAPLSVVQLVGIPGVIGIKFGFSGGYATSVALAAADQAGIPSGPLVPPQYVPLTAVMDWNNLLPTAPAGADTTWNIAQDSAGNALSGVTLTAAGIDDGWYNNFSDCPDARLLDSFWKFNTSNGLQDGGGKFFATFTIANLPASTYDVYVYIDDNNGNYWGNVQANSVLAFGSNIDADGFNGADSDPCSLSTPLHTAAGYGNPANYVKMPYVATTAGGVIDVTAVMIGGGDFGISGIELVPSPDIILTQDLLPTYAETVVGDQIVYTADFNNSPAVNLQWEKSSGGMTNNINTGVVNVTNNGVITSTLTLNNVQLTDSGSYWLKAVNAANSLDVSYTSVASLVVSNSPAPVNNVIVNYADQTGQNFTNAWTINTNIDLIFGFPTDGSGNPGTAAAGGGNFGLDTANDDPTILANAVYVGDSLYANFVTCGPGGPSPGAGQSMTYTFTNSGYGFDVTNITVYGGWLNGGRIEQLYQVLYSTPSTPGTTTLLTTADYKANDPSGAPTATRTTLVPANGVLMHNVYAVEINWDFGSPQNGYCGYSAITFGGTPSSQIYPAPPILTQDTTPLTAEDVVGSQIILTAGFSGATSYQWLKNGTNLYGATTPTLTLNNLQLTNAGAYSLVASNSGGTFAGRACTVTVDPAPAAVGNVVTAFAYQTDNENPFGPTWETNDLVSSLIYGQNPPGGGFGTGDFTGGGADGGLPVLTDGSYGYIDYSGATHPAFADGGPSAGQYVIYTLGTNASGYSITNIQIAGGWNDDGRNSQYYTVSYSTVVNPTNFIPIKAVQNSPTFSNASEIRTTITPATGVLASNAYAMEVDFTTPPGVPNGYSGYSEISVFGSPSGLLLIAPPIGSITQSGGNLIVTGSGGYPPNSGYTWLTTTNLSAPIIWTTNSTGTLDATGAFSNSIPISGTPARFFRLRIP